LLTEE